MICRIIRGREKGRRKIKKIENNEVDWTGGKYSIEFYFKIELWKSID